jgi:opacity protein-like surface antigen
MFTASLGTIFGDALDKTAWAVAVGGTGRMESDLSSSFEPGLEITTLMPSIFVMVPVGRVRPYGIVGFGLIRQTPDRALSELFANISDNDFGYSIGGGVTYQFARRAGVRGDLRHFKARASNGITSAVPGGIVLGG